jgi:hypothetical protein
MAKQPAKTAAPATTDALEWSPTLNDGQRMSYDDAVEACSKLGDGWRLPTVQELLSIVDYTRYRPAIDVERFPDTKSGAYWSSTPVAWASRAAWFVDFSYGVSSDFSRDYNYAFVRAVRSVPAGQ